MPRKVANYGLRVCPAAPPMWETWMKFHLMSSEIKELKKDNVLHKLVKGKDIFFKDKNNQLYSLKNQLTKKNNEKKDCEESQEKSQRSF